MNIIAKDKVITYDQASIDDKLYMNHRTSCGPKGTKITFVNRDTGEVLGEYENKCVVTGSILNATNAFQIEPPVKLPTYNMNMELDNSLDPSTDPYNTPIVCLFSVGDDGCGSTPKDVYVCNFRDRIAPPPANPESIAEFSNQMLMPFRWVDSGEDLDDDLRKFYFGRKTYNSLGKIGYYFKAFDTTPTLHMRYADGTQITETFYTDNTDQMPEIYTEFRLRITRLDFRDYFDQVLGWENARISSISLNSAWYDDSIDDYIWYQDIYPYTKLNFDYKWLVEANMAIDIIYQIYY